MSICGVLVLVSLSSLRPELLLPQLFDGALPSLSLVSPPHVPPPPPPPPLPQAAPSPVLSLADFNISVTNVELAKRVGISAPPCLRRVRTLEEQGFIRGYHADVDARELGFEVQVFAMVGLNSQAEADLSAFEDRCRAWSLVRECHMLNGEVDFVLKCVAPDLSSFQSFLTGQLLTAPNVASVKTSLVIRNAKDDPGVPFDVLEERLSIKA